MEQNNTQQLNSTQAGFVVCSMDSSGQRLAKLIAFGILLIVSLVGNGLVCLIVYKNKNMRTTINYLLVNMAVSDLAIPILVVTRKIVETSTNSEEWRVTRDIIGDLLCKFVFFLSDISPIVSILSLLMISFDRFTALVVPLKAAHYPAKLRKYYISLTWLIAIIFCSPYFYYLGLKKYGEQHFCMMLWDDKTRRIYSVTLTVLFIIIPFTLLIVMYSCILYKIKTRPMNLSQTERGRRRSQVSKRNITILSFTVVFIFAVCWGPYFAILMLSNFKWNWEYDYCSYLDFIFTVQFLAFSNAAINPILYFLFLKNFRAALENFCVAPPCKTEYKEPLRMDRRRSSTTQLTTGKDKTCNSIL